MHMHMITTWPIAASILLDEQVRWQPMANENPLLSLLPVFHRLQTCGPLVCRAAFPEDCRSRNWSRDARSTDFRLSPPASFLIQEAAAKSAHPGSRWVRAGKGPDRRSGGSRSAVGSAPGEERRRRGRGRQRLAPERELWGAAGLMGVQLVHGRLMGRKMQHSDDASLAVLTLQLASKPNDDTPSHSSAE